MVSMVIKMGQKMGFTNNTLDIFSKKWTRSVKIMLKVSRGFNNFKKNAASKLTLPPV